MYDLKNVLNQSPEKVKVAVLAVGGVVCAMAGLDPSLIETVGVGIAVERVLDLLYVAPKQQANQEEQFLKALDMGKRLVPTVATVGRPAPRPLTADPET